MLFTGIILGALIFRMAGVALCMAGTKLKLKERVFCMLAYTPKATVQAAIGGVPLSMGLACGNTVLTVAVLAIIITAPLGAFAYNYCICSCSPAQTKACVKRSNEWSNKCTYVYK